MEVVATGLREGVSAATRECISEVTQLLCLHKQMEMNQAAEVMLAARMRHPLSSSSENDEMPLLPESMPAGTSSLALQQSAKHFPSARERGKTPHSGSTADLPQARRHSIEWASFTHYPPEPGIASRVSRGRGRPSRSRIANWVVYLY